MRPHSALYVDAGYLLAAAATRITGSSLRTGIQVDYNRLVHHLIGVVEERTSLPLLRVYWYDAARDGKATPTQEQIALLPRVKVRLGRVGVDGEQKGVDLRIGLDMVGHSRNGAIDTVYLLSGDDDLSEAVEEAQAQGVQVVVLAVPNASGQPQSVSRHLLFAADDLAVLPAAALDETVQHAGQTVPASGSLATAAVPNGTPTPSDIARRTATAARHEVTTRSVASPSDATDDWAATAESLAQAASRTWKAWQLTAAADQRQVLAAGRPSIPSDLDRALLVDASAALAMPTLTDPVRVLLRHEFWKAVDSESLQAVSGEAE
ncbi:NYN domain-containing protein [Curtobacterium flaccumfaciens pv. oortii]|uniref:NYN domain-containing protein n=1 Tax=Curtobacterium flaccumfaciens TaxID=2035 RepID=UPI00265B3ADC|nr:NYN domain-containing protein [Curtobacterium flaccumfaciens]MCS5521205.1 NYN domain-containing protein [Curtobacterium flaccumfaciens pv. oortii]